MYTLGHTNDKKMLLGNPTSHRKWNCHSLTVYFKIRNHYLTKIHEIHNTGVGVSSLFLILSTRVSLSSCISWSIWHFCCTDRCVILFQILFLIKFVLGVNLCIIFPTSKYLFIIKLTVHIKLVFLKRIPIKYPPKIPFLCIS